VIPNERGRKGTSVRGICAIPFPEKDNKSSKLKKGITGLMQGICLLFI
jgi:hypothetical protein